MDEAGSKDRGPDGRSGSSRPDANDAARFEFTISSNDDAASRAVQRKVLDEVHRRGFNEQSLFAIKLALVEAMLNADKHGNHRDPKKKVHVEVTVTPGQAEIIVEDEGAGFKRAAVPDPTLPENLEKCGGRGIHLMEAYMNRVEWSHGGRRVRMVKRNEPDLIPRA
jgi:serine/threonine-protein kinase RsbW